MIHLSRRGFLSGLGAVAITAPAIVHAGNLMPVRVPRWPTVPPLIHQGEELWFMYVHPTMLAALQGEVNRRTSQLLDAVLARSLPVEMIPGA